MLSLSLLIVGCEDHVSKETEKTVAETIFPVEIITVAASNQNDIISSAGTLRFRLETELGFTTSGKIENVLYNEGDRVKKGALLANLDSTVLSADINVARAELERSKSEFDRIESLFKQGWVTKARLEQSQANYKASIAAVERADFASDTSKLYAPSNGVIINRNIDPGQIVNAGSTGLVFGQLDSGFIIRVPLTSIDASKITIGMPVSISISAIPNEVFSAFVSEIDGRADETTGSFFAIVQLPSDNRLRSGQIGTASFTIALNRDTVSIPSAAISGIRAQEGIVYIYEADKMTVSVRNVSVGPLNDNMIEITEGLTLGEKIIVRGHEKLNDGVKVKPVERGNANNKK